MKKMRAIFKSLLTGGAVVRVRLYLRVIIKLRESYRLPLLAKFVAARLQNRHGVFISHQAKFSRSLFLPHPVGIVIGRGVKLGERVRIYQNVTIGGARLGDWQTDQYPEIGDDTVIFAGAVVIGKVRVGKHCVVASNAVVTKDVPDYTTVGGIPAHVIHQKSLNDSILEQDQS